MLYTHKGKKVLVLVFSIIITLLVTSFKSVDFVCSPWEQLTIRSTREPEDDYLFCNTGNNLTSLCMLNISEQLQGRLIVDTNINESAVMQYAHNDIQPGGIWEPSTCVSCQHVAIIIPYKNRYKHLKVLLHFLIPVLQRQLVKFRIFVVEQKGEKTFNKGRVMNAGFKEAIKLENFDCYIFHDVDMIPEDDRNMYTCISRPRHMSVSVDKFNYELPYFCLVGGVLSFRREHFEKVNGYSNMYWGWGAEDDDMYKRLKHVGLGLSRPSTLVGRYKMIRHDQREELPSNWRYSLLATAEKRFHRDGLNSLDYNVTWINNTSLFTHIMVDIVPVPGDNIAPPLYISLESCASLLQAEWQQIIS